MLYYIVYFWEWHSINGFLRRVTRNIPSRRNFIIRTLNTFQCEFKNLKLHCMLKAFFKSSILLIYYNYYLQTTRLLMARHSQLEVNTRLQTTDPAQEGNTLSSFLNLSIFGRLVLLALRLLNWCKIIGSRYFYTHPPCQFMLIHLLFFFLYVILWLIWVLLWIGQMRFLCHYIECLT